MDDPRLLAEGYRLDVTDPDILVLRRLDGSFVAAFSAWGASEESIRLAAREDPAREGRPTERRVLA